MNKEKMKRKTKKYENVKNGKRKQKTKKMRI